MKNRADFASAQNTQLLEVFFARAELLALPGADSLSFLVSQKKKGKTRSSSVGVRDFCSLPATGPSSPVAEQFKHLRTIKLMLYEERSFKKVLMFHSKRKRDVSGITPS